jgi:hypothetical protein
VSGGNISTVDGAKPFYGAMTIPVSVVESGVEGCTLITYMISTRIPISERTSITASACVKIATALSTHGMERFVTPARLLILSTT